MRGSPKGASKSGRLDLEAEGRHEGSPKRSEKKSGGLDFEVGGEARGSPKGVRKSGRIGL